MTNKPDTLHLSFIYDENGDPVMAHVQEPNNGSEYVHIEKYNQLAIQNFFLRNSNESLNALVRDLFSTIQHISLNLLEEQAMEEAQTATIN